MNGYKDFDTWAKDLIDYSDNRAAAKDRIAKALKYAYSMGHTEGLHENWVKVWDADTGWQKAWIEKQEREHELQAQLNMWRQAQDDGL